jgi:hypothetical protein
MIFVGILLTSVVPMLLVMQQADNYRERQLHKTDILDEERNFEFVEVYPIPALVGDTMNITLINLSELPVEIVRLRINSTIIDLNTSISTLGSEEIGPFPLIPVNGSSYDIRVTTVRGNVFASEIGVIHYVDGEWQSEILGFRLIFPSRPGRNQRQNNWLNELKVTIKEGEDILYSNSTMYWAISASEKFFELQSAGDYQVTVYILCKGTPNYWDEIYDASHGLTWPIGPPIIELKFKIDGDNLGLE